MYLTQGLHRSVQRHPDRVALSHIDDAQAREWTFAELYRVVGRRAAWLQANGVASGERVAILAPNNDDLVISLLACWWLGAVACPMNTRWSAVEWRFAVDDCGAKLALFDESLAAVAQAVEGDVRLVELSAFASQAEALAPLEDSRTGGTALATILYTGGTTGKSKGVMLTHANFWSAMMARGAELNNPTDSVSLLVAPLFHVGGLGRLIGQLIVGASCITLHPFRPEQMLASIEVHRITDIFVVPTMLQMLMETPGFTAARVRSLNRIAFGAAPMPPALLQQALAIWPEAVFFQAYGMTETAGAVSICMPLQHLGEASSSARIHSVGRAGLGAEIRIVDEGGKECPRGEVGEIVLRGPMVMQGYWGQPAVTQQAFRDGWLRTGDGARMDDAGYIFICDRIKDMIISGGENVYPAEVEAVLTAHPEVAMAAVLGLPDAHWGEAVHAVIVARGNAADGAGLEAALRAWCKDRLASFKCPKHYRFEESLPLSAAGKVLKTALRTTFRSPAGQEGA